MFALNENNKFFLFGSSTDLRKGFNTLMGCVRSNSVLNPVDGSVYIFVNKPRTTLKLLHWERGGFVIYHKRLESGCICNTIFKKAPLFYPLRWDELVLLLEGLPKKQDEEKDIIYETTMTIKLSPKGM